MNNQQRNEPCHCGSGKKYKVCCLRKDEAAAQLSKQKYDVRQIIKFNTMPYIFWKEWSAACARNEFGLVYEMLRNGGELRERFKTEEDFFVNLVELGLPFEPIWSLDKIKLDGTQCRFLCRRRDDEDKSADHIVSMMTMNLTPLGYRVENIEKTVSKSSPEFLLSFELFGVRSAEHAFLLKAKSGWVREDLSDLHTRYIAPDL